MGTRPRAFVALGGSTFHASCLEVTSASPVEVPVQSPGYGRTAPALPVSVGAGAMALPPLSALLVVNELAGGADPGGQRSVSRGLHCVPGTCSKRRGLNHGLCFKQGILPFLLGKSSEMARAREYPVQGEILWSFRCVLTFY